MLRYATVSELASYFPYSTQPGRERPLRNFDTKLRYPYCYESRPDNRLESVANAHTAADLRARPSP
jgi:hypothetical protein